MGIKQAASGQVPALGSR